MLSSSLSTSVLAESGSFDRPDLLETLWENDSDTGEDTAIEEDGAEDNIG